MFYCQKCAEKYDWPKTERLSLGPCEMCDKLRACYDMPSSQLPESLPSLIDMEFPTRVINALQATAWMPKITTTEQLLKLSADEVKKYPGLGPISVKDIKKCFARRKIDWPVEYSEKEVDKFLENMMPWANSIVKRNEPN